LQGLAERGGYQALIALGCIIRGETYHFELVANESGAGVSRVALDYRLPVANAILTTENLEQAIVRQTDKGRDAAVRLAALDALSELPAELVAPVRERAPIDTGAQPALEDPAALRAWLSEHAASAPLSALHAAVSGAREHEQGEPAGRRRDEWTRARGAAHVALAHRGSRVAVYDLRESFDRAHDPLPGDFLAAAARVGDDSCLEPMARAWAEARNEPWWRSRLMESAADIVARLKLTGRNATLKRLRNKWPGFV